MNRSINKDFHTNTRLAGMTSKGYREYQLRGIWSYDAVMNALKRFSFKPGYGGWTSVTYLFRHRASGVLQESRLKISDRGDWAKA